MSWINEELPVDWPSKGLEPQNGNESDFDFTTSKSSDSIIGPTVSIQPKTQEETPQWKEAIRPLDRRADRPHLTGIFDLPNIKDSNNTKAQHMDDDTSDFSSESPSTQSTSEHNEAPQGPISRRLKVFGRPDTYTNERLGNLLSSMGGGATHGTIGTDGTSANIGTSLMNGTTRNGASRSQNTHGGGTANESDMDLADNLQHEGRKVLQGLTPYRPDLSAVQESSLDELEQQLTSHSTTQGAHGSRGMAFGDLKPQKSQSMISAPAMDTTTSDSGARTLDSLHSSMSNWDTFGGTHAAGFPPLHKKSSNTLCGTGRSHKPENEISALAISEPVQPHQTDYITSSEQPSTSEAENLDHRERQMSQSIRSSLNSRKNSAQYYAAFDMTPEPNMISDRLNFRSPLTSKQRSLNDEFRPSHSSRHLSARSEKEDTSPKPVDTTEPSIAIADVSFSAAYERLSTLLRERAPSDRLNDVDSLDLNSCDLESMVGLDKFVPGLTTLFISGNSIRSLQGLPSSVVHLDLSMNCISPVNTFPTSFISTLILSNNELVDLEPLKNLRALCSLDVSDNKLRSLRGIRSFTALRSLNISGNQLQELDLNLGMLVELDASHNQISAVNLETPLLESLDLEANRVVALNNPMPNLRVLNIRSNNATVDFQGWSSLETLLFDGNKGLLNLDAVAGNLATFSWEQPVKAEMGCKLDTRKLSSVRDLKLGYQGQGWKFGLDASLVYAVQHLDLAYSGIRELPPNIAQMFPFLISLNLAFNKLDDRCIECLKSCTKLERLSLFSNRLTTKGQELAAQLPTIRVIDSRAQRKKQQQHLEEGLYPSDLYTELMETNENTIITVKNQSLQWLDGRWTNFSGRAQKHTTRPGFQSPLYPLSWEERQEDDRRRILEATTVDGTSLIGSVTPVELLKAMYVHHWRQLHSN